VRSIVSEPVLVGSIDSARGRAVAAHSPILLGYPRAKIYILSGEGIAETSYDDTDIVGLTRTFLEDLERFLQHLFEDAQT